MTKIRRWAASRNRPPTLIECALAAVTASLAFASMTLAVAGSARASSAAAVLLDDGAYSQPPFVAVASAQAAPPVRPTPSPTATPTPTPTPPPAPTPTPGFMPLPVDGLWKVVCGYRCGLHDDANSSTFALDIARIGDETAGQPVRSPVDGRLLAVVDSSSYVCDGTQVTGPEAGAVIIVEFPGPGGGPWRLRLAHLEVGSVPQELRPAGRPVPVSAGTLLGSVATLGRCSHLHLSLTSLDGEREVPQPMAVLGRVLEDCGAEDCWRGATLPPASPEPAVAP